MLHKPLLQLNSIQKLITFWTGLCLLVAMVAVVGYTTLEQRRIAIHDAENQARAAAYAAALPILGELELALGAARSLADGIEAVKRRNASITMTRDQVIAMLGQILYENPQFVGVYTLWEPQAFDGADAQYAGEPGHEADGRFVPYWSRGSQGVIKLESLVDYEEAGVGEYYQCPKRELRECVIDPYIYPVQGEDTLITSLVVPIIVDGTFYGIIGIDVRLDFLQRLTDQVDLYEKSGKLMLVSYNGSIAAATGQPELIGSLLTAAHTGADSSLRERLRHGEAWAEMDETEQMLNVFVPLHFGNTQTPWSANIRIPRDTILAPAVKQTSISALIGAVITLIGLVLIWFVAGRIAAPIRTVTGAARHAAEGRLEDVPEPRRSDETSDLARAYNQMISQLRRIVESERAVAEASRRALDSQLSRERVEAVVGDYLVFVEQVAQGDLTVRLQAEQHAGDALSRLGHYLNRLVLSLAESNSRIQSAASAITSSAAEILSATSQQSASAAAQLAAVTQTTATVAEVQQLAHQTAQQSTRVARDSQAALTTAHQGAQVVKEAISGMGRIRVQVEEIAQTISSLARQMQDIGAITATVSELADQSNMLALNAAIEAARAGQNGRSFSVVAHQMRELAERSKAATVEVRSILQTIQQATDLAVRVTRHGAEEADQSVLLAGKVDQVINQIAGDVENSARSGRQITTAAEQQMSGVEQIGQATGNIQQAAQQALAGIRQVEQTAQDLQSLARSLLQATAAMRVQ